MFYQLMADIVVVIHFSFILFAGFGGLLVLRWRRWAWLHVPAAVWAVMISFGRWICPLTPLENWFRERSGEMIYQTSFVEQYIVPLIYAPILTRHLQIILVLSLLGVNLVIYGWVIHRYRKRAAIGR